MRRKEIATLIERYDEHERYGELTEDDRITHWLMKKVFELTKGEKEEPEPALKKIDYVPAVGGHGFRDAFLDAVRDIPQEVNAVPDPWWADPVNAIPVPEAPRPQVVLQPRGGVARNWRNEFVENWADRQRNVVPNPAPEVAPEREPNDF